MEVKKNIYKNFLAGLFGKFGQVGVRLLQVPILISYLGVEQYGTWILLSSIPSWLSISNLGFGTVAGNDAAIAAGENNIARIEEIYSSTMVGVVGLVVILSFGCALIVGLVDWNIFLETTNLQLVETQLILLALSLTVLIGFIPQIESIKYRVENKNHRSIWLNNIRPWIDFLLLWVVIQLDKGMVGIAVSGLVSVGLYSTFVFVDTQRACRRISVSKQKISKDYALHLIRKGLIFQAFPVGNAVQNQGYIMVVNYLLGPVAVTLFTTLRTLVRSANQVMELVNQSVWPELSYLLGAKRMREARDVHDKSVKISGIAALGIVLVLLAFGPFLYSFWLGKAVEVSRELLIWFILPIPLTAWWFTSSVVLVASNQYEDYALRYILISVLGLLAAWGLGYKFGMPGIAISLAVIDLLMIWYIRGASLKIVHS